MSIPTTSERAAIADAVAAVIQAAAASDVFGSVSPTVQRCYVAIADLDKIPYTGPLVSVIPLGPENRQILSRKTVMKDLEILVGIEQRLPQACDPTSPAGNQAIDAMDLFVEQLAAVLEPDQSATPPRTSVLFDADGHGIASWSGTKVVVYNYNRLREDSVYTSSLIVKYLRE